MKLSHITFPHKEGIYSAQAHADLPKNTYEREISRDGFYGPSTHMYHKHPLTSWQEWEGELFPRAFDFNNMDCISQHPYEIQPFLYNSDTQLHYWQCSEIMQHLIANADGDEILFIHGGHGEMFCDFGHISYTEGDYILIPRSTQWRLEPKSLTTILMIEATNEQFYLPEKGMLGSHAIFDRGMFKIPEINDLFIKQQENLQFNKVQIKKLNKMNGITFPYNPLDAVGWKGEVTVAKINWRDIRPIISHRYNLPPSAHCTFITKKFDVGTFVPRPIESDPGALKVPFYHSNADEDEFMFFHKGQFFSRDNIGPGMATFHQTGFVHGPHPKALKIGMLGERKQTDEVAIKIDFRNPAIIARLEEGVEIKNYKYSWLVEEK
ncbi:MAG: homogentisate 1,2-dioxygenase [Burkholderiales bacterium]|nr:homogentisate 1,2-dioxygenase [Burkholderiales bacterium]